MTVAMWFDRDENRRAVGFRFANQHGYVQTQCGGFLRLDFAVQIGLAQQNADPSEAKRRNVA